MTHFRKECKHGIVYAQCRCPATNKTVHIVPCEERSCNYSTPLTDAEITEIAYAEIFQSARSLLEDWIDEDGDYSEEDFKKIRDRALALTRELEQKYL